MNPSWSGSGYGNLGRMRQVAVLLLLAAAACGKVKEAGPDAPPNIDSCAANQFVDCVGTVARICDGAGTGTTDMECGAPGCNMGAGRCNACVPDGATCGTNTVEHCGPDGLNASTETCSIGCTETPTAHCTYIEPTYAALANICDTPAVMPALTISTNQSFDTASDLICTGGVVTQASGPPICVVRFGAIKIDAARTLTVQGVRALALVADRDLVIAGTLDVGADGTTNGPGGGTLVSGGVSTDSKGGGGAGAKTAGAPGGTDAAAGGAANGGGVGTDPANLVSFVGGSRPANPMILGSISGGGGGAAILISCRGQVSVTGVIDAGGGGGGGGRDLVFGAGTSLVSAAGGGAGGNVVLQGAAVSVTGSVFANGGAGGGGTSVDDQDGLRGDDGSRSTTSSAVGGTPAGNGGSGGSGGRLGATPTAGNMPAVAAGTAGGGGGSTGFLQTYTPMGVAPTLTPAAASPGFQPNLKLSTR